MSRQSRISDCRYTIFTVWTSHKNGNNLLKNGPEAPLVATVATVATQGVRQSTGRQQLRQQLYTSTSSCFILCFPEAYQNANLKIAFLNAGCLSIFLTDYHVFVLLPTGAKMIPISWTEMQCPKTYVKEHRKVAKVQPEHITYIDR